MLHALPCIESDSETHPSIQGKGVNKAKVGGAQGPEAETVIVVVDPKQLMVLVDCCGISPTYSRLLCHINSVVQATSIDFTAKCLL